MVYYQRMSKVLNTAQLDNTLVGFTKPELVNGQRTSLAYVECPDTKARRHLYVQLPISTVVYSSNSHKDENADVDECCNKVVDECTPTISIRTDDPSTVDKFVELEDYLTRYFNDRSAQFFDGRRFSLERFQESLVSACDLENGCIRVCIDKKNDTPLRIKDQFDGDATVSDLKEGTRCIVILVLRDITFNGKTFSPNWSLLQAKVYKEDYLKEWYLQDASESSSVSEAPAAEQNCPDDDEPVDQEPYLEPLITNDDDKNFF